jgi:hypothetical protein
MTVHECFGVGERNELHQDERRDPSLTFAIGLHVGRHQQADAPHAIWLLPSRRERPRRRRATEEREERAAF